MQKSLYLLLLVLMPVSVFGQKLGVIDFPTTVESSVAQDHFIRGVKLLHSFEYQDAAEAFRQAQEESPGFVMAHWGEAMSHNHPIWQREELSDARESLTRLAESDEERVRMAATEKEADFITAVNLLFGEGSRKERAARYLAQMEVMADRYPDDHEVMTFYALAILGTSHDGRDFSTYMKAAAIAEVVFAANPLHPGAAHYLIHSYDDPIHAPLGVRAADVYSEIAPDAAHALHMPTHIYVALGQWDKVERLNERSWLASEVRVRRKGLEPTSRSYHAIWWRAYALMQQDRQADAKSLIEVVAADASTGHRSANYHLAAMQALYVIDSGDWEYGVNQIPEAPSSQSRRSKITTHFVSGYAHAKLGNWEAVAVHTAAIRSLVDEIAQRDLDAGYNEDVTRGRVLALELDALSFLGSDKEDKAILLAREAATLEESMPFEFGPPGVIKPAHELLGEVYLAAGQPNNAVAAFQNGLRRNPMRRMLLQGLAEAASKSGRDDLAERANADLRSIIWSSQRGAGESAGQGE